MPDAADQIRSAGAASPPATKRSFSARALDELGLVSLYQSSADVKLLCAQRFVRLFAYGSSTLVLVAYLEALAIPKTYIGLFMTLTLAGDVLVSFILTLIADAVGRRATLALGALLMAGSGALFAVSSTYWLLLAAAVLGVITPSGNEIGPFRAVEDSIVAHVTAPEARGDIYAWFNLVAKAGAAFGMIVCGWVVHFLVANKSWTPVEAYRSIFALYAALGVCKLVLALALSNRIELDHGTATEARRVAEDAEARGDETAPLLRTPSEDVPMPVPEQRRGGIRSLLPNISKESRPVMFNLCVLFALNAFSSGLAPLSWLTYFFRSKFGLEEGKLGTIFFAANLCSAASVIVAASLAKRFGNVNVMVFTHLPSSIFMALIGLPNDMVWALVLLFLRDSTKSMNVGPRSAFLAAAVLPHERTAMIGLTNVVKTLAQTVGPSIAGGLAERDLLWVAFLCAGIGKVLYDVGLLVMFRHYEKDTTCDRRSDGERSQGERESEALAPGQE